MIGAVIGAVFGAVRFVMPVMGMQRRPFALLLAGLAGVSLAFPLVTSVTGAGQRGSPPTWVGLLDVGLAAALLAGSIGAVAVARPSIGPAVREVSYRFYRALAAIPLILFVAFLLLDDRLAWDVLLPGLGWRMWLLVYVFPSWLALWRGDPHGA